MGMGSSEVLFREYRKALLARDEAIKAHGADSEEYTGAQSALDTMLAKMPKLAKMPNK
jgi:hypothetical protein